MNVHFPGGAPPVTTGCDVHATTHGNDVHIELYATGRPGAELRDSVGFDVTTARDGADLAGASFVGDGVFARAHSAATGIDYQLRCGDAPRGEATVIIGPAVATQQSAEPVPTRWWTLHGSASAKLVQCVPEGQVGGTAVVEASF